LIDQLLVDCHGLFHFLPPMVVYTVLFTPSGSHESDLKHVDPSCPRCRNVRAVLLSIANLVPADLAIGVNSLSYNIDSHSDAILCLPNLGNRSAVWVSIYVSWNRSNGQSFETDLLNELRTLLNKWQIHQR